MNKTLRLRLLVSGWRLSTTLLLVSFVCSLAGKTDNIVGAHIANSRLSAAMYFLLFPLFALVGLGLAAVNLWKHRSIQFGVEVVLAVLLIAYAVMQLVGPT